MRQEKDGSGDKAGGGQGLEGRIEPALMSATSWEHNGTRVKISGPILKWCCLEG
jgi:hypothetical protein